MGNTRLQAQALSAPPYLVSFVVVITTSYLSDRFKSRSAFVIGHSLVGAFGYAVLAFAPRIGLLDWKWRYAAVYLASSGIFSAIAIIIPWTVGNSESSEGRGTGVAILNLVGYVVVLSFVIIFFNFKNSFRLTNHLISSSADNVALWLVRDSIPLEMDHIILR